MVRPWNGSGHAEDGFLINLKTWVLTLCPRWCLSCFLVLGSSNPCHNLKPCPPEQFSSVAQSCLTLCKARQASLSISNSQTVPLIWILYYNDLIPLKKTFYWSVTYIEKGAHSIRIFTDETHPGNQHPASVSHTLPATTSQGLPPSWLLAACISFICIYTSIYSWPLNNTGLNCSGPHMWIFFQ